MIVIIFIVCVGQTIYIVQDNKKDRISQDIRYKLLNKINKLDSIRSTEEKFYQKVIKDNNLIYDSLLKKYEMNNSFYKNLYAMTWDNVCFWVDYFKIKHPNVVKAQILLETCYLNSDICNYNRNLFGMKYFKSLNSIALGEMRGHAFYGTYVESIIEYKMWQDKMYKYDNENYYRFLERIGYAKDPNYIPKVKFIMKKNKLKYE